MWAQNWILPKLDVVMSKSNEIRIDRTLSARSSDLWYKFEWAVSQATGIQMKRKPGRWKAERLNFPSVLN